MTIGLARGTVQLEDYDPSWHKLFLVEAKQLGETLNVDLNVIQHVGSTSIPTIKSKPIIDIAIPVQSLDIAEKWAKPLSEIGYWYKGAQSDIPDRRFFAKGPESKRTIYLHIVNQEEYQRMTTFRDRLLTNKNLAKEYSDLKEKLAKNTAEDRIKYTSLKNDFIQSVLNR